MAGLDPAIHLLRNILAKRDGCAGPGYAKASPGTTVSGRRSFSEDGKPAHDESVVFGTVPALRSGMKNAAPRPGHARITLHSAAAETGESLAGERALPAGSASSGRRAPRTRPRS